MIELKIKPLSVNNAWQGKRYRSKEYQEYRKILLGDKKTIGLLTLYKNIKIKGFVEIEYIFNLVNFLKTDCDNLVKPLQDILVEYGIIEDDRFILKTIISKVKDKKDSIKINIKSLDECIKYLEEKKNDDIYDILDNFKNIKKDTEFCILYKGKKIYSKDNINWYSKSKEEDTK